MALPPEKREDPVFSMAGYREQPVRYPKSGYSQNITKQKYYTHEELESMARGVLKAADYVREHRPDVILAPERGAMPLAHLLMNAVRIREEVERGKGRPVEAYHPHIMYFPNTANELREFIKDFSKGLMTKSDPQALRQLREAKLARSFKQLELTAIKEKGFLGSLRAAYQRMVKAVSKRVGTRRFRVQAEKIIRSNQEIPEALIEKAAKAGLARKPFDELNEMLRLEQKAKESLNLLGNEISEQLSDIHDPDHYAAGMDLIYYGLRRELESEAKSPEAREHLEELGNVMQQIREDWLHHAKQRARALALPRFKNVLLLDEVVTGSAIHANYSFVKDVMPRNVNLRILALSHRDKDEIEPHIRIPDAEYVKIDKLLSVDRPWLLGITYLTPHGPFRFAKKPWKGEKLDKTIGTVPAPHLPYTHYKWMLFDVVKKMRELSGAEEKPRLPALTPEQKLLEEQNSH
jgi:hypoxanthine phosphoribosyltransferase